MVVRFLLSFLTVLGVNMLCTFWSGAAPTVLLNGFELPGIIIIFAVLLFLSGYGKDFCRIFATSKKIKNLPLEKIRRTENSIDFAMKALFYVCLFFMIVAAAYFYINIDERKAMGPNLATVICSLFYMVMLDSVLIVCKAAFRKQAVSVMAEECVPKAKGRNNPKNVVLGAVKVLCAVSVIIGMSVAIILSHTKNLQQDFLFSIKWLFYAPSLIYLAVHGFILILLSGNFTLFFKSFRAVFAKEKITEGQKSLYQNAVATFRGLLICGGMQCTLVGFIGVLTNLTNRAVLGANVYVAMIPAFYSIIFCLALLIHQSKISE